jgi:ABC-type sugar transport system substrate-binding protein
VYAFFRLLIIKLFFDKHKRNYRSKRNGVFVSSGQGDISKQIAACEDLITKGVDNIISPKDPDALVE